jgi:hypothetical protein
MGAACPAPSEVTVNGAWNYAPGSSVYHFHPFGRAENEPKWDRADAPRMKPGNGGFFDLGHGMAHNRAAIASIDLGYYATYRPTERFLVVYMIGGSGRDFHRSKLMPRAEANAFAAKLSGIAHWPPTDADADAGTDTPTPAADGGK